MPKENIWLIEGIHDLLVPKEEVEDLFQAWGKPDRNLRAYRNLGIRCR